MDYQPVICRGFATRLRGRLCRGQSGVAVDNSVDNYGTYPHAPHSRLTARHGVFNRSGTLPHTMPGKRRHGPENGIAVGLPDEENPAHGGARKNPTGLTVGLDGGLRPLFEFAQHFVGVD